MNRSLPAWTALAALSLAILAACGGDDPTPPSPSLAKSPTVAPSKPVVESELAAFEKIAPKDQVLEDDNLYDTTVNGTIALSKVNEDTAVKRHTITINGKVLPYVARTGHLLAYHGVDTGKKAKAAIFYTAYTRDGLPKANRPVTFLWNGGPGSASIWLHLGSWGPKRLKSDAPNIADPTKQPDSLPFEDNAISLLDQSDLVFVDPPGTGLSTAIEPLKNRDLWGTDADAEVIADFITSYTNKYNRQSSPKYLYGESYGGIRTPIVANLLEQAGTSAYAPDPSDKPAKVLTGFILNSPLVNYNSSCDSGKSYFGVSCAGFIPSYAMTADYFKTSTKRGTNNQAQYLVELRKLARTFDAAYRNIYLSRHTTFGIASETWKPFISSPDGQALMTQLAEHTGTPAENWAKNFNQPPGSFRTNLIPGNKLGRFDARMKVPKENRFESDDYINVAFINQMKTYLPDFLNYRSKSKYEPLNDNAIRVWEWPHGNHLSGEYPQSITDIQAVLIANPAAKLLILHGYEDIATPGFQTELDLEGVNLLDRIPVKWFEGGHMTYNTESSRAPLKQALNDYYGSPTRAADGSML